LYQACDHFLSGVSLELTGIIPRDPAVREAVVRQEPFCIGAPESPAALAVDGLAAAITRWEPPRQTDGNIKFFWKKLLFG
ncbi:MinD/ParA family protein, partial [uncultured Desulfovibrio sp.]